MSQACAVCSLFLYCHRSALSLWDRPARINRRVRLIWPLILPSDSTQEPDCSYPPLRHIGHFDAMFLSRFFQSLEIMSSLHSSASSCATSAKLSGTIKPPLHRNRSAPNRPPPDHPALRCEAIIFATIHCVVPHSFANRRTLAPSLRNNRIRSSSAEPKCRSAGRPILLPARRACAMPAFTLSRKSSLSNSATAPKI